MVGVGPPRHIHGSADPADSARSAEQAEAGRAHLPDLFGEHHQERLEGHGEEHRDQPEEDQDQDQAMLPHVATALEDVRVDGHLRRDRERRTALYASIVSSATPYSATPTV